MHFEYHARRFGPNTQHISNGRSAEIQHMTTTLVELARIEQGQYQAVRPAVRLIARLLIHCLTRRQPLLRYGFLRETLIQRHQHDTNMQRTPVT